MTEHCDNTIERKDENMYFTAERLAGRIENEQEYEAAIEAKLTTAQRKALPSNAFGLPEERKYPLIVKDEDGEYEWNHLKDAIAYFHTCKDEEKKKTLAGNIAKVIKKYNVDVEIKPGNKIRQYANFS